MKLIYKERLIHEPQCWIYIVGIIILSIGMFIFYDSDHYKSAMLQTFCLGSIVTSFIFYVLQRATTKMSERIEKAAAEVLKDEP